MLSGRRDPAPVPGEERAARICRPLITADSFLSSGGSDGAVLLLTAFRIRYIVRLDEALEPALPASTLWLAVGLILGAGHAAYGAYFVDRVKGMPACGEPIKPRCFHVVGEVMTSQEGCDVRTVITSIAVFESAR